jgi:hypothetical protein
MILHAYCYKCFLDESYFFDTILLPDEIGEDVAAEKQDN